MKTLDYFYNEYLLPVCEEFSEAGLAISQAFFVLILFLTVPIWIIPYLIHKKRNESEVETE